ncbi:MAG: hypothetical protein JWQ95_2560 [Sphaerisporangium sp.]|jgi:hypothetical protein|nr:hypothetical protein [Sphaerisporangium sp.]
MVFSFPGTGKGGNAFTEYRTRRRTPATVIDRTIHNDDEYGHHREAVRAEPHARDRAAS